MPFAFEEQGTTVVPGGTTDVPTPSAPVVNRPQFAFERNTTDFSNSIRGAIASNPDAEAKTQKIARETNVPADIVKGSEDQFAADLRAREIENLVQDKPVTQQFLANPNNANIAHDDVQNLSWIESIARGWKEGRLQHDLGVVGSELRDNWNANDLQRVRDIQAELQAMGEDPNSGFVSYLNSVAQVGGQWTAAFGRPSAAVHVAEGGGLGALTGLAGGPLAPITVPAGTVAGLGAGVVAHLAWDSFQIEGGQSYVDMLDMGIDRNTATWLSVGVGAINAGLEIAGGSLIAHPFTSTTKTVLKEGIRKALISKPVIAMAAKAAKEYGAAVLGETSTEVGQELVQIVAEEWGKSLNSTDIEHATPEQIQQRLESIAEQTMKAMVILGVPGAGMAMVGHVRASHRAGRVSTIHQQLHEAAQESKLAKRDPDLFALHMDEVLKNVGHGDVSIPADALIAWLDQQADPKKMAQDLGVENMLTVAHSLGQDVTVPRAMFAKHILMSKDYANIADHIRENDLAMTPAEAKDFAATGFKDELQALIKGDRNVVEPPIDPAVDTASAEIGLKAMFKTAQEAGMTDKQYQSYLDSITKTKRQAAKDLKEKELRRQEKALTSAFNEERKAETEQVTAQLRRDNPVYSVMEQMGGMPRLDRAETEAVMQELGMDLKLLPKQEGNKTLYATKAGELTISPHEIADIYGFEDAHTMLAQIANAKPLAEAVSEQVDKNMAQRTGEVQTVKDQILEARKALMNDDHLDVLVQELNALREHERQARAQERVRNAAAGGKAVRKTSKARALSSRLVRAAVRDQMQSMAVRDLKPHKFMATANRLGMEAGKAIRKGDRATAERLKFQQIVNHQMAQEAFKLQEKLDRQRKYLAKFRKERKSHQNMATKYLAAIRGLMDQIGLFPKLGKKKLEELRNLHNSQVNPVKVPAKLLDAEKPVRWDELSLTEFQNMYNTVREIHHKGTTENRLLREREKMTVQDKVNSVIDQVEANLLPKANSREAARARESWDQDKRWGPEIRALLYTADTMLRLTDGLTDLGASYMAIKAPYDKAMAEGYQPGQIGYLRRQAAEAKKIKALYEGFSKQERIAFDKKVSVPGITRRIKNAERLAVLLNTGNAGNIRALVDSGTTTEQEIRAIQQHATKKEWDFVQSVWDYLETFWPEIVKTEERRRNFTPEKVQAQAIDTPHGTYRGGYYPIKYHASEGSIINVKDVENLMDQMKYGSFVSSHTKRGHVESRVASGNNVVTLDPYVLNQHVDQVIYDLEVGDAVTDVFKVLHHNDLKTAYYKAGYRHYWEGLDLWLRDVITGELGKGHFAEKALRHLRTGLTISRMGWNIGVMSLQFLGIGQSSVQISKKHMWRGLRTVMSPKNRWFGEDSVFKYPGTVSGFMETRRSTFHKDIHDAMNRVRLHFLDKITPGNSAAVVRDSFFWGIIKAQGFTDAVTWYGAVSEGMEKFNGDRDKAIFYADRMVARTQASGIFGDRTALERGSVHKGWRQSEGARVFTTFISYFMAKTNVAAERIVKAKKQGITNPGVMLGLATDLILLYTMEALMSGLIQGQWPDPDSDESWLWYATKESIAQVLGGFPVLRDFGSALLGYKGTGGTVGSITTQFGQVTSQWSQGEIDSALLKSTNNLGGALFHYPSSQVNRSADAIAKAIDGEDINPIEFVMGQKYKK